MVSTGISWTNDTWNPTLGCDRISPGCDGCYAIRDSARQVGAKHPAYEGVLTADNRDWSGRVNLVPDRLDQPIRWKRPRMVFVNSMSDLFHQAIPAEFIGQVFATMAQAQRHTFQVLTKRPQRMASVLGQVARCEEGWFTHNGDSPTSYGGTGVVIPTDTWPLPNVWLGVSIESQTYAWRARHLAATPAAVRFVSAEPLVGALDLGEHMALGQLDWVIIGGESGPRSRMTDLAWIEALVVQCREEGVTPFVKQLGHPLARALGVPGKGTELADMPESVRVQEWPETATAVTVG